MAKTKLKQTKEKEIKIRKQKQLLQQKKSSHKDTKCLTEERQIMALQYAQQEDLREAVARTAIHTGFELTDEVCAYNKERQALARTAR